MNSTRHTGFAPFAGVEIARVKPEIKDRHRSDFGLKLINKAYYQKYIWDSSLPISNSETLTSKREDQISSMQVVFHLLVKSSITASTFAADSFSKFKVSSSIFDC